MKTPLRSGSPGAYGADGNRRNPQPRYRMLVSDIDGTLLTSDAVLPDEVRATILEARRAGIVVTVATGRRYVTTEKVLRDLELHGPWCGADESTGARARRALRTPPVIVQTGAIVTSSDGHTTLFRDPLPQADAQTALDILVDAGLQPIVYENRVLDQHLLTGPAEFDSPSAALYLNYNPDLVVRLPYEKLIADGDPLQLAVIDRHERLEPVVPRLESVNCRTLLSYSGNVESSFMEVFHKDCSKGHAVARIARYLGFSLDEVVCIGDNWNDTEMLAIAGCGIAVANAAPEIAIHARRRTVSNNEQAVAQVLRQMMAGEEPGYANPAFGPGRPTRTSVEGGRSVA